MYGRWQDMYNKSYYKKSYTKIEMNANAKK